MAEPGAQTKPVGQELQSAWVFPPMAVRNEPTSHGVTAEAPLPQ